MKAFELFGQLSGFIFPKNAYCLCCGDIMEPSRIHGVCDVCASKIEWITSDPFEGSGEDFSFDEVLACCRYGAYPRRIVSGLKLGSRPYAAEPLGLLLAERLMMTDEGPGGAIVVPVPMYIEKKKQRGFNQAELLAKTVSKEAGLSYRPDILIKTKPTKSMRFSSGNERRLMQNDVFALADGAHDALRDARVILVDDVITTGSTADACASVLKSGGAAKVSVLCFAVSASYDSREGSRCQVCEPFNVKNADKPLDTDPSDGVE